MSRLPVLDNVRIASPCDMDWSEMTGDDQRRHCEQCDKNVYNLNALSPEAFVDLVERTEGKFCGRIFKRSDGTVLTDDCPVGVRRLVWKARRRAAVAAAFSLSLIAAGVASFARFGGEGCTAAAKQIEKVGTQIEQTIDPPDALMGDVAIDYPEMGEVEIELNPEEQ